MTHPRMFFNYLLFPKSTFNQLRAKEQRKFLGQDKRGWRVYIAWKQMTLFLRNVYLYDLYRESGQCCYAIDNSPEAAFRLRESSCFSGRCKNSPSCVSSRYEAVIINDIVAIIIIAIVVIGFVNFVILVAVIISTCIVDIHVIIRNRNDRIFIRFTFILLCKHILWISAHLSHHIVMGYCYAGRVTNLRLEKVVKARHR